MDEIEVPPFFICPISLEIMKDPVTVSTGITYDRDSIETWLFSCTGRKNNTCPVTKQVLSMDSDQLTPNVTLRRLIQSWCTLNSSNGIERFPTPKAPVSKSQLTKILNDAVRTTSSPQTQIKCLEKLKSIASYNASNKRCMETAGAVDYLSSIIIGASRPSDLDSFTKVGEEALSLLYNLHLSEKGLKSLFQATKFTESLIRVMKTGSYESRAYAVMLMKSMSEVAEPMQLINLGTESFFTETVQILRDQISMKASKAALKLLITISPAGRNRVKAVEAGAVRILIDQLLDSSSSEKRKTEMLLTLLDLLCQCAEGRAELLSHAAGLAVVSKKILRVSQVGTERAVRILYSIGKFAAATPAVVQEMLSLGVVAKLCLVLQVDCGNRTKERAREILKLHARSWKNSPCVPLNLLTSYPC